MEDFRIVALGSGAKSKLVRLPMPMEGVNYFYSHIDWVNVTFKKDDYLHNIYGKGVQKFNRNIAIDTEMQVVSDVSRNLTFILGYGVTDERSKGLHFFQRSFDLGHSDKNWGSISIGGQQDSVMISLTAQGILAAKTGWQERLYRFLMRISTAKITRIDLAHDAFNSQKTVTDYFQLYLLDGFSTFYTRPSVEQRGDWINESIATLFNRRTGVKSAKTI